jgi:hypothetical protein
VPTRNYSLSLALSLSVSVFMVNNVYNEENRKNISIIASSSLIEQLVF